MQLKQFLVVTFITLFFTSLNSQIQDYSFGEGLRYKNKDATFQLKAAFRFQSLFVADWNIRNDKIKNTENLNTTFLIRRSRLKFDGYALSPKLEYKLELGLSNRDIGAGEVTVFNSASNLVLDAYVNWNFYKGFSILVGQTKLPGNRERVISSGNLQFVDRSRLNSRINLDRDMGIQFSHEATIGKQFGIEQKIAISQGEGRNVTYGNIGGLEYTYHMEIRPFGKFASGGDFSGSDLKREQKPKLAIGLTFDMNEEAGRSRGNLGSFFIGPNVLRKTLYTGFADMMFKYKGFSMMGEFAIRGTEGNNPTVYREDGSVVGTYFTGSAINLQAGYLFEKNYEFSFRYTKVRTQNSSVGKDESQYFIGFSRYIVGHKLKIQSDFGYEQVEGGDDGLIWRLQLDFHL